MMNVNPESADSTKVLPGRVTVTGIDIGVGDLALLMVKVALAAIPAALMLAMGGFFVYVVGGMLLGLLYGGL